MGWYGDSILNYQLLFHESEVEGRIKGYKPKSFFENLYINAVLYDNHNESKECIHIPFLDLYNLKLKKKYYDFERNNVSLKEYLFYLLQLRNIELKGYVFIEIIDGYFMDNNYEFPTFYLISSLQSHPIKLSETSKPKKKTLSSYEDIKWIQKNGLKFEN